VAFSGYEYASRLVIRMACLTVRVPQRDEAKPRQIEIKE
jgi:hypothetical protein